MATSIAPDRRWVSSSRFGSLAAAFGRLTGRTPASAAQRISGNGSLKDEFKTFAIACRNAGRLDILTGYVQDLQTMVEHVVGAPQPLTLELVQKAQEADAQEDVLELQYHQTKHPRDLSMLIRACDREIAFAMMKRAALRAEELRRALAGAQR